ncbi:MAG TPA: Zn-dependent alcohol dehydrogenase [Streptosporangiaceae bacterium]|nr:Zn-dependent alcohol dehydrogenase [Streptosporangiaceae bacterium]
MRAVVFTSPREPVQVSSVGLDPPGPGEVTVAITAAGVCHSDLHVRRGDWAVPAPLVMGHEGAGVITETGPGVRDLAEGDHVVLSWVAACGQCRYCLAGHPARCKVAATVVAPGGVLMDGTSRLSLRGQRISHYLGVSSFAERTVVPASGAIKIRDDAPLDVVALIGCAVATGMGAVANTAGVEPGATVAVIGCGGVGLSVVQGARLAGASRIVAIDVRPEKTALAARLGATDQANASMNDPVAAVRDLVPDGVDYAFDAIGLTSTTSQAIAMLGLGGAAVIVGLPPDGATVSFEPLALAESDQRILGSNYGSVRPATDIPALVDRFMAGELELDALVSARLPLESAAAALDDLESGRALRTLLIP